MKQDHPSNRRPKRHLKIAQPLELPKTFAEMADESNRSASLRRILGDRSYWLCSSELIGIYHPNGLTVGELRFMDPRIPLAVRYVGTRKLTEVSYVDEMTGVMEPVELGEAEHAVLALLPRRGLEFEDEINAYAEHTELIDEVAIAMGQAATLLDENEHNPANLYVPNAQDRAFLRVVPSVAEGES